MFSAAFVCLFVCQHDNFRTSKHRTMTIGGRCIVQKSRPSSNLGVISPSCVRTPKTVALGYDVGKISAGCLMFFWEQRRCRDSVSCSVDASLINWDRISVQGDNSSSLFVVIVFSEAGVFIRLHKKTISASTLPHPHRLKNLQVVPVHWGGKCRQRGVQKEC